MIDDRPSKSQRTESPLREAPGGAASTVLSRHPRRTAVALPVRSMASASASRTILSRNWRTMMITVADVERALATP